MDWGLYDSVTLLDREGQYSAWTSVLYDSVTLLDRVGEYSDMTGDFMIM